MTEAPERMDPRSHDVVADRREELLRLFPEARMEDRQIDFDHLRLSLGDAVDVGRERYGMTWPGKADCFRAIQSPSLGTLRPAPEESLDFGSSQNLIIEGDNLEVLKLLQKSYLGKIKMIYIDPPYNIGSDFIYQDNYAESLQTYLAYTGQVDAEGRRFNTNTDADGRFHSRWLSMMYPRLYLARNLLTDDGAIFISIDDGEQSGLRKMCDEIFGEENFVATFVWQKRTTRENRRVFSFDHDYIVCFSRSADAFKSARGLLPLTDDVGARYSNPDNDPRGEWQSVSLNAQAGHATAAQFYTVVTPGGRPIEPPAGRCWSVTEARFAKLVQDNRVWFGPNGNNVPRRKSFATEARDGLTPHTLWLAEEVGTNAEAKKALISLFGGRDIYETPKPTRLMQRLIKIGAPDQGALVLDFFAGSGTTAHAVLDQNQEDGGNRRFILAQLPEPTELTDYPTIVEITKERVRRVAERMDAEDETPLRESQDRGFRVFKLAESNFTAWDAEGPTDAASLQLALDKHVDHIRDGRSEVDLLYEILLKSGYELTVPVEVETIEGRAVYSVDGGSLLVFLGDEPTLEFVRAMAERKPQRVVMLDASFAGNDQLKANAAQTFKHAGASEGEHVVFRTI